MKHTDYLWDLGRLSIRVISGVTSLLGWLSHRGMNFALCGVNVRRQRGRGGFQFGEGGSSTVLESTVAWASVESELAEAL